VVQKAAKTTKRRTAAKRKLVDRGADKRYVRGNTKGEFKESDDVGKSLSQPHKRKAKAKAKP
jgi:hypothetical protein